MYDKKLDKVHYVFKRVRTHNRLTESVSHSIESQFNCEFTKNLLFFAKG